MYDARGSGQVLWNYTGRKTLPPSTSVPVSGETVATRHHWADIFIVRRQGPDGQKGSTLNSRATCSTWRGMGSVRLYFAQDSPCDNNTQPFYTGSVAAWVNKDCAFRRTPGRRWVKYATGASSTIRGRDNITIGTWNTRTLRAVGKRQELTHEMNRYRWNILGLCEMRWKNFGETTTEEGHKVFFSAKEDKHEHDIGFLIH